MECVKLISKCEDDTIKLGEKIGKLMFPGAVICLEGDLGAGKTLFTQSLCRELGVHEYVTSPTFTIINEYNGLYPIYHFDAYRIEAVDELYEIGFDEYIFGQGVCIIEWANLIKEALENDKLWINISRIDSENIGHRNISITAYGEKYEKLIEQL